MYLSAYRMKFTVLARAASQNQLHTHTQETTTAHISTKQQNNKTKTNQRIYRTGYARKIPETETHHRYRLSDNDYDPDDCTTMMLSSRHNCCHNHNCCRIRCCHNFRYNDVSYDYHSLDYHKFFSFELQQHRNVHNGNIGQ